MSIPQTPFTIPKPIIAGRQFNYNDIQCGVIPVASAVKQNSQYFWGGIVDYLGKTKEGFLLAISSAGDKKVLGFYVPDLDGITPEGIALLEQHFGGEAEIKPPDNSGNTDSPFDKMSRNELVSAAKARGKTHKEAFAMKSEALIEFLKGV